jgi:hypothetical protein
MKRYVIDSIKDIQEFFTDLHLRTRKSFSPEDDLESLLDSSGAAVFSKAEAAYFDDIVLDCFVFCSDHRLDLHEIVEGLQQQLRVHQLPKCRTQMHRPGFSSPAQPQLRATFL